MFTSLRYVFLASLISVPALAGDCPQSCISSCFTLPVCTADSTGESASVHGASSFDIPSAHLAAQSSCFENCCADVTVNEDFTLEGLPLGTPIAITARLDVRIEMNQGYVGGGGAGARLTNPLGGEVQWSVQSPDTGEVDLVRDTVLTLPLSVQAGSPFRLGFGVNCGSSEMIVSVDGVFSFDGLPSQSSIVSCRGFTQIPVPTRTTTWGGVKARYR